MSEVIWSEFDADEVKVTGITKSEYIEVIMQATGFEVRIWSRDQSSSSAPSHSIIGNGDIERGKQAAEQLLEEGLGRF